MIDKQTLNTCIQRLAGGRNRTRFAPSPTGYLHNGHLLAMLWVSAIAERFDADIYLRIEDHDQSRSRPIFVTSIMEDLKEMGAEFSGGLTTAELTPTSIYLQSNQKEKYRNVAIELLERERAYWCDCSRAEIKARQSISRKNEELVYDGFCRERGLQPSLEKPLTLRLKVSPTEEVAEDLFLQKIVQSPYKQCGDFSLWDRFDQPTYQFCCVLDDLEQKMNVIIRGEDLLGSVGRQLYLKRVLVAEKLAEDLEQIYAHHPLIVDENQAKLSKRQLSASLRSQIENNESVQTILNSILMSMGIFKKVSNYRQACLALRKAYLD